MSVGMCPHVGEIPTNVSPPVVSLACVKLFGSDIFLQQER